MSKEQVIKEMEDALPVVEAVDDEFRATRSEIASLIRRMLALVSADGMQPAEAYEHTSRLLTKLYRDVQEKQSRNGRASGLMAAR